MSAAEFYTSGVLHLKIQSAGEKLAKFSSAEVMSVKFKASAGVCGLAGWVSQQGAFIGMPTSTIEIETIEIYKTAFFFIIEFSLK